MEDYDEDEMMALEMEGDVPAYVDSDDPGSEDLGQESVSSPYPLSVDVEYGGEEEPIEPGTFDASNAGPGMDQPALPSGMEQQEQGGMTAEIMKSLGGMDMGQPEGTSEDTQAEDANPPEEAPASAPEDEEDGDLMGAITRGLTGRGER